MALSTAAKIAVVVAAFAALVTLSPVLASLVGLAFVVSALVATVKGLRSQPARGWGIAAVASVALIVVSTGVSNAVYGPTEETATSETTQQEQPEPEEPGQAKEANKEAPPPEEEPREAERAVAEASPPPEEETTASPEPAPPPKPQTPEEKLRMRIEKTFMEPKQDVQALELRDSGAGCYNVYVKFNASPGFTRSVSVDGTEYQMQDVYKAAYAKQGLANLVCSVTTEATGELTDNRGNVTKETVYSTSMDSATADTINWKNAASVDFPSVWTVQYEHPALTQQRSADALDQAVDCADDGGLFDFDSFEC